MFGISPKSEKLLAKHEIKGLYSLLATKPKTLLSWGISLDELPALHHHLSNFFRKKVNDWGWSREKLEALGMVFQEPTFLSETMGKQPAPSFKPVKGKKKKGLKQNPKPPESRTRRKVPLDSELSPEVAERIKADVNRAVARSQRSTPKKPKSKKVVWTIVPPGVKADQGAINRFIHRATTGKHYRKRRDKGLL